MKTVLSAMIVSLVLTGAVGASEHPEHPKAKAPAAAGATATPGQLDGKVFVGELGKAGQTTGDKDELVFKQGLFVSTACVAYGFNDAPYTATEKDGIITFTSAPSNSDAETMTWTGTIKNGALEGKAVHKTASGETTYWFKGKVGEAGSSADHKEHPKKSEHPEHPEHPKK